jgi:hypothetical protein
MKSINKIFGYIEVHTKDRVQKVWHNDSFQTNSLYDIVSFSYYFLFINDNTICIEAILHVFNKPVIPLTSVYEKYCYNILVSKYLFYSRNGNFNTRYNSALQLLNST